jgi:hypothetical protein
MTCQLLKKKALPFHLLLHNFIKQGFIRTITTIIIAIITKIKEERRIVIIEKKQSRKRLPTVEAGVL